MSAFDLFALPFDIVYLILDEFDPESYGVLALTNKNVQLCCVRWYLKVIRPRHLRDLPFKFSTTPFTKFILTQHRCTVCEKPCWHGRHHLCIHRTQYRRVMKRLLRCTRDIEHALNTEKMLDDVLEQGVDPAGYVDLTDDYEADQCTISTRRYHFLDGEEIIYWYVAHAEIRLFSVNPLATTSIDDRVAAFKAAGLLHE